MPLHIDRLVHAEGSFARLGQARVFTVEACYALGPGNLVVLLTDPDPCYSTWRPTSPLRKRGTRCA